MPIAFTFVTGMAFREGGGRDPGDPIRYALTVANLDSGDHGEALLAAIVEAPERRISELPLLARGEEHALLLEWNDTASDDGRGESVHELIAAARRELGEVPGRQIRVFNPAEMMRGAGGNDGELEFEIRGNLPLRELDRISDRLIAALYRHGGFVDLNKSLKLGLPELRVIPDREKAAALGVDARTVSTAVRMMIGGMDVGVFKEAGLRYDIRMRLEEGHRNDPGSIGHLYVRAKDGRSVKLRNLTRLETGAAPSAITRSNRQRSVAIGANLEGLTLGEAIEEAFRVAGTVLPEGVTLGLAGSAEAM